ncbi:hypothetical protein NDU88_001473 [Pleurodeles waltl]|uniref:DDE Tnp4 domain-containing protein n=1 Tax=Pleurodeles waltl TaxID=8319 RepID=A0AAV7KPK4_PLEWA|nr:hypothetical protein NDU88_001473 [Pleurodeles waltl]
MALTSAAVTSAAVRTITAIVHRHWLLGPIGSNVNQCSIAPRSLTAYRDDVQRQRSYLTSRCPTLGAPSAGTCEEMAESSGVPTAGGPVDNGGATFDNHLQFAGDSGYPNLSWLLTSVRNPRTRAEERYNEAHGRTRRVIERTFGLLKARFRCLHLTGGSLFYSPKKVYQIIVACCMLHNLALRRQVPFLQEDGSDGGVVAAVEPVDSEEEEAEEEDMQNRDSVIQQYFQ